ncbi:MAG: hypothetical protein Q9208_000698 [Pyrenodesmia sp. 3 TL-2023]
MATIYIHQGTSALSTTQAKQLAIKLGVDYVQAPFVHYIALHSSLTDAEWSNLNELLTYGEVPQPLSPSPTSSAAPVGTFYVLPRTGTISPWSSNATSVAYVCGLEKKVIRIERGIVYTLFSRKPIDEAEVVKSNQLHDRMTQTFSSSPPDLEAIFTDHPPAPLVHVELGDDPQKALETINNESGLSLDATEIAYLVEAFGSNGSVHRNPTDVELFMFSQVNSEHCRHKIFNAQWAIDGITKSRSLFSLIRETHERNPQATISAYSDNAAVLDGARGSTLAPLWNGDEPNEWKQIKEQVHTLIKVETHNHPTAISPYPGAATGSGGEIRDEGAVGRGSKPKAGLCGFAVSDLLIPGFEQPWELAGVGNPKHVASSLQIMLEAPVGSARFNNEFGRACINGFFRNYLTRVPIGGGQSELIGYHKPIMLAGGVGTVRPQHALKNPELVLPGDFCVVLGGPAMLIGLGGGSASSVSAGEASVELDYASVQRANPEVQRQAQEVINACCVMGLESPIAFIHDVGAGGLSNALPELVHDAGYGATFDLQAIDNADKSLSPKEIFCNEAQERYVMIISRARMDTLKIIAERERCGYSVVGHITGTHNAPDNMLVLNDGPSRPIDLPMSILFGKTPTKSLSTHSRRLQPPSFDPTLCTYLPQFEPSEVLGEAVDRLLALGTVGSKEYLITIGDRSVGGLVARDQMVGPWQTPVADCGVTATSLTLGMKTGEAMAVGERPAVAIMNPAASVRLAIAESLTNIAAAHITDRLEMVKLSANWMASVTSAGQANALYEGVEAASNFCAGLGISIPVGKDSMSMKMAWEDKGEAKEVIAPLSLIASAFAPVVDYETTWTPVLKRVQDVGETVLMFVDLALGKKNLGGSCLAQCFGQTGRTTPDVHNIDLFRCYFSAVDQLHDTNMVLSYHDRSDGGLMVTLTEMMFSGRCGLQITADDLCAQATTKDVVETLFNEELGAVFQVRDEDESRFIRLFAACGLSKGLIQKIGRVSPQGQDLTIHHKSKELYRASRAYLQRRWASTSYHMARLRDNPEYQDLHFQTISDGSDPGLSYKLTFDPTEILVPNVGSLAEAQKLVNRPKVAILRDQGSNGASEMAFAMMTAGFMAVDVHMTDIISGRITLDTFRGLAACGGFSYGDVLGSGRGWANSVLLNPSTRIQFVSFFARKDTFAIGVCNGCQFLSRLKELIPGASNFPTFRRNLSEQHEARTVMVEITKTSTPNVFFSGMQGSFLPVSTSHGEGRASFASADGADQLVKDGQVPIRYVTNYLEAHAAGMGAS